MKNLFILCATLLALCLYPSNTSASSYDGSYSILLPQTIDITTTDSFQITVNENNLNNYQKLNIDIEEELCLVDEYGKANVYGQILNTNYSLHAGEIGDYKVTYSIDNLSAGNWSSEAIINISIENLFPEYMTISGPSLNSIFQSLKPKTIAFSQDTISSNEYQDISLAQDESVKLYFDATTSAATITTASNNKIVANYDFSKTFKNLTLLTSIDGLQYLDTSNCTDMSEMFASAIRLTAVDLKDIDTSSNTSFTKFFYGCSKLVNINNLSTIDTSSATDLSYMFYNNAKNTTDLSAVNNWDVSNVENFSYMFYQYRYGDRTTYYNNTDLCLNNWDVSNAVNMSHMFENVWILKSIDTSSFINTSGLVDISYMFNNCKYLKELNLSSLNTSSLTNMAYLFKNCINLSKTGNLNNWQVSLVNDMSYSFYGTWVLDLTDCGDLNSWIVNEPNTSEMFGHASSFTGREPLWY